MYFYLLLFYFETVYIAVSNLCSCWVAIIKFSSGMCPFSLLRPSLLSTVSPVLVVGTSF